MIYVLTAYSILAKKGLGEKCFQASFEKIKEQLQFDPIETGIQALLIGPRDLNGIKGNSINESLIHRNKNIVVIYIYQKDSEMSLVKAEDIFSCKIERPSPDNIVEIVDEALNEENTYKNKSDIINAMFGPEINKEEQQSAFDEVSAASEVYSKNTAYTDTSSTVNNTNNTNYTNTNNISNTNNTVNNTVDDTNNKSEYESYTLDRNKSIEEEIAKCSKFKDWNFFKMPYKQEVLNAGLINENTAYAEALNIIDNHERQLINVFKDPRMSPDNKFAKIKEIGIEKTGYKATVNNILVDKFINTVSEVVFLAKNTIEEKLADIKLTINQMTKANVMHSEKEKLEQLMAERVSTQMKLLELSREVIEIYKSIDSSADEVIANFEQSLPSENSYINEVMKPFKRYFVPQNSAVLANRILSDLQSEKLVMSNLESKVMSMVSLLFKLCEGDDTIIDYQSKLIKLLSAQKVEDIVVVDTILKNCLRLYIGASDVGRTSTCITIAKILSRRNNSLLIDLSGSSKFADYGINALSLEQFMAERIEQQFVCVEGNANGIDDVEKFIGELKLRLNYYPYINIILDEGQEEVIRKLSESALSVNFITNCTNRANGLIKNCISKFNTENIARKIILIDPQIDTSEIISEAGADMIMYKVITIPYLAQMKACSLKKMNPADVEEVAIIFDSAF